MMARSARLAAEDAGIGAEQQGEGLRGRQRAVAGPTLHCVQPRAHQSRVSCGQAAVQRRAFMSNTTAYARAVQSWNDGWRRAARAAPLSFRVISYEQMLTARAAVLSGALAFWRLPVRAPFKGYQARYRNRTDTSCEPGGSVSSFVATQGTPKLAAPSIMRRDGAIHPFDPLIGASSGRLRAASGQVRSELREERRRQLIHAI